MLSAEKPLPVDSPDEVRWHDAADVVVVGFGGAGALGAIEARQGGADVLAFDHFEGGGATAVSGGVNYAGATRVQREGGIADDVEESEQ